ncbi:arginase family protein [Bradyrhizobium sp. LHD-71]|uniref:arginase family protein n=1 Tax=Bradyrhizobium sp. LHD-71 TaxID=3072141 RepID=UPI00280CE6AA|nr:arginase family protein [Bradyrhizobium sp. LHD-71]MDQ8731866.1 arginase family protein [Bradyrhizobium sp. LHD-71]
MTIKASSFTEAQLLATTRGFMGVPWATSAAGAKAAILGVPFDCGTHAFRIGSRQGPASIRAQSRLVRAYESEVADYDIRARLNLVDCGDVVLTPSRIEDAFARIEEAAWRIVDAGATPVGFGGDGSISVPLVRAAARKWPDLCVLHIDSHTDCHPVDPEHPYDAATQFSHAALEQRVSPSASYHVGIRGPTYRPGVMDHTRSLGYNIITMRDYVRRGEADVLAELHDAMKGRPVYLSWDMDSFDPSVAPGVCTPTWGGFSAREGLQLLRGLAGLDIVAVDINTVSPPHDVNEMTAYLAAYMAFETLLLLQHCPTRRS